MKKFLLLKELCWKPLIKGEACGPIVEQKRRQGNRASSCMFRRMFVDRWKRDGAYRQEMAGTGHAVIDMESWDEIVAQPSEVNPTSRQERQKRISNSCNNWTRRPILIVGIWSGHGARTSVAMIRGLRQVLTRTGCLQALESGPTLEEPSPAGMADYDHVYHDNVTGASLPSKFCEEAKQLEIKCMKEMNVYTPCEHGAVKEQGLTPIGTRWVFADKGDSEHPFIRARLVAQETKRTTKMDLTDTSMTFTATPPVEGFRFLLSRAMTGEKKRIPQEELVTAFFDISGAHFHSSVRRKEAIRVQGYPSCPQCAQTRRRLCDARNTGSDF